MEDMGAVLMYPDPFRFFTVNIASNMLSLFYHKTSLPVFSGHPGKYGRIQAASYQKIIILFHPLRIPPL